MKKIVVLSGSGISAESGLKTFRDSGGLWEGYNVYDVATPEAWQRNPELVLQFYNERRRQAINAKPNKAHLLLAKLQDAFNVTIITQNVDNLHEKAGSKNIIHLHGELFKSRSTRFPDLIYGIKGTELNMGDKCEKGFQLRPHIVWFGEAVPLMNKAAEIAKSADVFLVIGTSLQVYPAAGLVDFVPANVPVFVIDPSKPEMNFRESVTFINKKAVEGMNEFFNIITESK
ncbi:MAG: NAD-dependent deacylase [Bacteroidota bacterium]|nr:NAD-dependent deacylase [Bacteroidota bacterium]